MLAKTVCGIGIGVVLVLAGCQRSQRMANRSQYLIGYTDMKCDDPRGQFYNWRTRRAVIIRADGTGQGICWDLISSP